MAAALWMESEGPNKPRTNALLQAIVSADSDALRMDAYPLPELIQTIGVGASNRRHRRREQLANADVLLTTTYIGLVRGPAERTDRPRRISPQAWHIDARTRERWTARSR